MFYRTNIFGFKKYVTSKYKKKIILYPHVFSFVVLSSCLRIDSGNDFEASAYMTKNSNMLY